MTLVFSDNFNRADSTTVGGNWVEDVGDWKIATNALALNTGTSSNLIHNTTAIGSADYQVEVTIGPFPATLAGTGPGIRGRVVDNNNFYLAHFDDNAGNGQYELFKCVAGSFTQLGLTNTAATMPSASITGKLSMQGSTLIFYIATVAGLTVTDATYTTEGHHGLRAFATSSPPFDNYNVYDFNTGGTAAYVLFDDANLLGNLASMTGGFQ